MVASTRFSATIAINVFLFLSFTHLVCLLFAKEHDLIYITLIYYLIIILIHDLFVNLLYMTMTII